MRALYCSNFVLGTTKKELEDIFSRYGTIKRIKKKSTFAFVYFDDVDAAKDAIRDHSKKPFVHNKQELLVQWAQSVLSRRNNDSISNRRPVKTLYVSNIDTIRTKKFDIERHFEPYGKVVDVRMCPRFAFVQFKTQKDATRALEGTHNSKILDKVVSVEYALREYERGGRSNSPRRDYGRRGDGASRSRGDRSNSPRRDYGRRGDGASRSRGDRSNSPRRDYGRRGDGASRSRGDRYNSPRRDYGRRGDGASRSRGDRSNSPGRDYGRRGYGVSRSRGDRYNSPRRDYGRRGDGASRSRGDRSNSPGRDYGRRGYGASRSRDARSNSPRREYGRRGHGASRRSPSPAHHRSPLSRPDSGRDKTRTRSPDHDRSPVKRTKVDEAGKGN